MYFCNARILATVYLTTAPPPHISIISCMGGNCVFFRSVDPPISETLSLDYGPKKSAFSQLEIRFLKCQIVLICKTLFLLFLYLTTWHSIFFLSLSLSIAEPHPSIIIIYSWLCSQLHSLKWPWTCMQCWGLMGLEIEWEANAITLYYFSDW